MYFFIQLMVASAPGVTSLRAAAPVGVASKQGADSVTIPSHSTGDWTVHAWVQPMRPGPVILSIAQVSHNIHSGCYWADAYTVRKWTKNLRTFEIGTVPTKRNKKIEWCISKAPVYHCVHQIQQNKLLFANDACFPFTILACVPSVVVCLMCT